MGSVLPHPQYNKNEGMQERVHMSTELSKLDTVGPVLCLQASNLMQFPSARHSFIARFNDCFLMVIVMCNSIQFDLCVFMPDVGIYFYIC